MVGYLVHLNTVGKMEKLIEARQWDRELNVLNTESFLWAENDIAYIFAKSPWVMEIP